MSSRAAMLRIVRTGQLRELCWALSAQRRAAVRSIRGIVLSAAATDRRWRRRGRARRRAEQGPPTGKE